ncbi:MAG: M15 family metallopeptidase [Treponema sp.]|nr:M15 family metallopeptidase [Treponema sp.]
MTRGCRLAAVSVSAGIAFAAFLFSGCSAKTYALPSRPAAAKKMLSAEEEKCLRVCARMSGRAQAEMQVNDENRAEFLSELLLLLEEEKSFRKDDKSLFFLIDKTHTAERSYVPRDLILLEKNSLFDLNKAGMKIRPEAYDALNEMAQAALADGIRLLVSSVYRSYAYQENLFNYWVSVDGLEEAERESARAGTSQHQLGTAADFGSISDDFGSTEMGRWMYSHAAEYGWSLSFPKGYEDVTGYRWECWHFRFLGKNACRFQKKWFGNIQQFMLEFLYEWEHSE